MKYKKVEEFLKENALFLDKKCKNCTGSLEAKDFSVGGCTRYECTQCGTSYTSDGKQTVTANRVKAANEGFDSLRAAAKMALENMYMFGGMPKPDPKYDQYLENMIQVILNAAK